MATIDFVVVGIYLALIVIIGFYLQKKASENIDSYFLGGRRMPWWVLGASGMAANVDISGTMINVALVYALGSYALFIEFRGGVVLILAFLMAMMGKYNRRSQVMTLAEWMHFRFGKTRQGDIARLMMAIVSLILTVALISYFSIASGKFAAEFLNIDWRLAAFIMILIAGSYCVASGLYAVVWIDVFQGLFILAITIFICFKAFFVVDINPVIHTSIPLLDGGFQTIRWSFEEWTRILPPANLNLPGDYSIYNLLGLAVTFYLIKAVLEGFGGGNSYMAQRYFAAKNDKEAGLLSFLWTILLMFRWPLTASFAVLGVYIGMQNGTPIADPEAVLPVVINELLPVGVKGLVIAGFIAAAMSTLDATVNAGASYWVKDIYQAYINPKASDKKLMIHSKMSTVLLLLTGLLFSFSIRNVNEIWGWTMMGIAAGMLIPQFLRWYWWRFNGYGFAIGMITGTVAAIAVKLIFGQIPEYLLFIYASGASFLGCIIGTLMSRDVNTDVLQEFYNRTQPFGFWKPLRKNLPEQTQKAIKNENNRDLLNVLITVPWQVCLFLTGMMVIYKRWDHFIILTICLTILSIVLYFNWYKHLDDEVEI